MRPAWTRTKGSIFGMSRSPWRRWRRLRGFWWSQPPDLLYHPPTMATETPRQATWFNATAAELASAWWSQPPDLLRRTPPHLDTNEPRLVSQQFATPGPWRWAQPPDLLRHPQLLDTNQGFDYAADPIGRGPVVTPSLFWWAQPLDLIRHPAFLETNQSRLVAQLGANMWWIQPPFLPLRAPGLWHGQQFNNQWALSSLGYLGLAPQPISPRSLFLWGAQPYVAPGWAFRRWAVHRSAPPQSPCGANSAAGACAAGSAYRLSRADIKALVVDPAAGFLRHAPGLWTWQNYIGNLPPRFIFRGARSQT